VHAKWRIPKQAKRLSHPNPGPFRVLLGETLRFPGDSLGTQSLYNGSLYGPPTHHSSRHAPRSSLAFAAANHKYAALFAKRPVT